MTMKTWVKNNQYYELHFQPYSEDNIVLTFCQDIDDKDCYWYKSELLGVEQSCEFFDSIEDAKEEFESMIEEHYKDIIYETEELLEMFQED